MMRENMEGGEDCASATPCSRSCSFNLLLNYVR